MPERSIHDNRVVSYDVDGERRRIVLHTRFDERVPVEYTDIVFDAGFLPEERAWLDRLLRRHDWVDTFRHHCDEPGHYTWWSYRPGVRARNIGWRLDYFVANSELMDRVARVRHQHRVRASDHCPVELELQA